MLVGEAYIGLTDPIIIVTINKVSVQCYIPLCNNSDNNDGHNRTNNMI